MRLLTFAPGVAGKIRGCRWLAAKWTHLATPPRRGRLSSRRIPASVGALRISAPAAGSITAVFSQLMALARYTSVGSHSAYGMGVIDVVADAP